MHIRPAHTPLTRQPMLPWQQMEQFHCWLRSSRKGTDFGWGFCIPLSRSSRKGDRCNLNSTLCWEGKGRPRDPWSGLAGGEENGSSVTCVHFAALPVSSLLSCLVVHSVYIVIPLGRAHITFLHSIRSLAWWGHCMSNSHSDIYGMPNCLCCNKNHLIYRQFNSFPLITSALTSNLAIFCTSLLEVPLRIL